MLGRHLELNFGWDLFLQTLASQSQGSEGFALGNMRMEWLTV
jgi:hypothetical protein